MFHSPKSPPTSGEITIIKNELSELFNFSRSDVINIQKNKKLIKIILKLFDKEHHKPIRKFFKYIENFELKSDIVSLQNLPEDVQKIIYQKYVEIMPNKYKIREWIDIDDLDEYEAWYSLASNHRAIDFLKENKHKLDGDAWHELSMNPLAIDFLRENKDKVYFEALLANPEPEAYKLFKEIMVDKEISELNFIKIAGIETKHAMDCLAQNIEKLNENKFYIEEIWEQLYKNHHPKAIETIIKNKDNPSHRRLVSRRCIKPEENGFFDWLLLASNPNDKAIELVLKYIKKNKNIEKPRFQDQAYDYLMDCIKEVHYNPNDKVIKFFSENIDMLDWYRFSKNKNPKAVDMIVKFVEQDPTNNILKIELGSLCYNGGDNTIKLFEQHFDFLKSHKPFLYNNLVDLLSNQNPSDRTVKFIEDNFKYIKKIISGSGSSSSEDHDFWELLSKINHPKIIEILIKNPRKTVWTSIVSNPSDQVVNFILENEQLFLSKRNEDIWGKIENNTNPRILSFLKKHKDKLDLAEFANNPLFFMTDSLLINRMLEGDANTLVDIAKLSFKDLSISSSPRSTEIDIINTKFPQLSNFTKSDVTFLQQDKSLIKIILKLFDKEYHKPIRKFFKYIEKIEAKQ